MKKIEKRTLGGITGYFSSFGSYFFTAIIGILGIYNLISQNFIIAGIWFSLLALFIFWLFIRKNRYSKVEFDGTQLYADGNKEIPLNKITRISPGIIEYEEGTKKNRLYFFYLPNDGVYSELKAKCQKNN